MEGLHLGREINRTYSKRRRLGRSLVKRLERAGRFLGRRNRGSLMAIAGAVSGVAGLFRLGSAEGAMYSWNTGTGTWSTTSNWSPSGTPLGTSADTIYFNGSGIISNETIYLDGNRGTSTVAATLVFNNTGTTTLLGGTASVFASNTLFIGSGGISLNYAAGSVTVGNAVSPVKLMATSMSITNDSSSSYLRLNNSLSTWETSGTTTFTFGSWGSIQVPGVIANGGGSNTVAVTADGNLTLLGANTYSGATSLTGGTLNLSNAYALRYSTLDLSDWGYMVFDSSVSNKAFTLGGLRGIGELTLQNSAGDPIALSVGNNNQSCTYAGLLHGSGSLVKVGTGTLTLTGHTEFIIREPSKISGNLQVNSGTVAINAGGQFTCAKGYVGNGGLSLSAVTVDGSSSTWTLTGDLYAAYAGSGIVAITAGGKVTNSRGYVGYGFGSRGTVTVADSGSAWSNTAALYVGYSGTGSLTISTGGKVTSTSAYLGYDTRSQGTVTVSDSGSNWSNTGSLYVGYSSTATLAVNTGGTVRCSGSYVGYSTRSQGTVTVSDSGSSWSNTGPLYVGCSGTGTLIVNAGGSVTSVGSTIGAKSGSGSVTLSGTGAIWTNSGNVEVGADASGNLGTGTITIGTGAILMSSGALRVWNNASSVCLNGGTLNVDTIDTGGVGSRFLWSSGTLQNLMQVTGGAPLVKTGSGTVTLTGTNTFTSGMSINGGLVQLTLAEIAGVSGPLGKSGTISFGGGAIQYSMANQYDYSYRFSSEAGQAYSVDTNGQSVKWAKALTSSGGSLTKSGAGRLTLSTMNTYSGNTTISGGTLTLSSTGAIPNSAVLSIATGATFDVSAVSGGFSLASGQKLKGTGSVVGALVAGAGSTMAAGNSVGTESFQNLTLSAGSNHEFEFNSSPANDRYAVSGTLAINGGNLKLYQEGTASTYDAKGTYTLMTFGSMSGSVGNLSIDSGTQTVGRSYNLAATGSAVQLTIGDEWSISKGPRLYTNYADTTDSTQNPGVAGSDAAAVHVVGSGGHYISEIDGLSSNMDLGAVQVDHAVDSPTLVVLWLNDANSGNDIGTLVNYLDRADVKGSVYDIALASVGSGDALYGEIQKLWPHYQLPIEGGFAALVKFNSGMAADEFFNWDFNGGGISVKVDAVAVVPEPGSLGLLGLGAMGLLGTRRRRGKRDA